MTEPADYIATAAERVLTTYAGENPVGTYRHESLVQGTLTANSCILPLVELFDYTTNQANATARVARANCTMYFGTSKPGQGDSAEDEAAAVRAMRELMRRFLATLDAVPVLELTNLRASPFHDAYEAKLTGVGVQFTLATPANQYCPPSMVPVLPAAFSYALPFALA
jgi:hypothetical protein